MSPLLSEWRGTKQALLTMSCVVLLVPMVRTRVWVPARADRRMDYCPHTDWHDSRVVSKHVAQWPKFTAWRKVSFTGGDGCKAKMHLKLGKPAIWGNKPMSTEEHSSSPGQTQIDMHHLSICIYICICKNNGKIKALEGCKSKKKSKPPNRTTVELKQI